MRQTATPAEAVKPCCHAVRVHGSAVILREHKTLSAVILAETQYLAALPCPVLPQKLHRLDRQRNITLRPLGFGRVLIDAAIGRILDIVADIYTRVVKIDVAPFKAEYLSSTCAGDKQSYA